MLVQWLELDCWLGRRRFYCYVLFRFDGFINLNIQAGEEFTHFLAPRGDILRVKVTLFRKDIIDAL